MFGLPIEGPPNIFCDNKDVYKNASTPESTLRKKQHIIDDHYFREAVAGGMCRLAKGYIATNLADFLTNTLPSNKKVTLIDYFYV